MENIIVFVQSMYFALCLFPGNPPSTEEPYDVYPIKINSNKKTQLVVQAYAHAKYLGFLNVTFNEEGEIVKAEGNPILINHLTPIDLEVESEKNKLQSKVEKIAKVNFLSKYLACGVPFEIKSLYYINIKTKGETFPC